MVLYRPYERDSYPYATSRLHDFSAFKSFSSYRSINFEDGKIGVNTESVKKQILRNSLKLRGEDNQAHMKKIFITPDLTPTEQKLNNKLSAKLKEKNKGDNLFKVKNGTIV